MHKEEMYVSVCVSAWVVGWKEWYWKKLSDGNERHHRCGMPGPRVYTETETYTRGHGGPHTLTTDCGVSVGRISAKLDSCNDLCLQLSTHIQTPQLFPIATDGLRPKLQEFTLCSHNTWGLWHNTHTHNTFRSVFTSHFSHLCPT